MKNAFKVVVLGCKQVGKTTLIEEALYGQQFRLQQPYEPTIEDIFCASVECDKNIREYPLFLYDYAGCESNDLTSDTIKMYLSFCDAFLIVFTIIDNKSFKEAVQIRKNIEKLKDKKDIPIVMIANKMDLITEKHRHRSEEIRRWASSEKIRLMETTAYDRKTICDCLIFLAQRLVFVSKSSFARKTKPGSIQLEL